MKALALTLLAAMAMLAMTATSANAQVVDYDFWQENPVTGEACAYGNECIIEFSGKLTHPKHVGVGTCDVSFDAWYMQAGGYHESSGFNSGAYYEIYDQEITPDESLTCNVVPCTDDGHTRRWEMEVRHNALLKWFGFGTNDLIVDMAWCFKHPNFAEGASDRSLNATVEDPGPGNDRWELDSFPIQYDDGQGVTLDVESADPVWYVVEYDE